MTHDLYRKVRGFCSYEGKMLLSHTHIEAAVHQQYIVGASHTLMAVLRRPFSYVDVMFHLEQFCPGLTYEALVSTTISAMGQASRFIPGPQYDPSGVAMLELLERKVELSRRSTALFGGGIGPIDIVHAALSVKNTAIRRAMMPIFGQAGYQPEMAESFGRVS